ncbi:response regulator [Mangrovimonas aestuarii]|uniref:response regulator n=1 Tax=Mangrovimonas aestuarii TaxID=3018443 RepID=UPI0023798635|nr:response regulator transcription factor [Mangrovimonas aestuarii]
MGASIVIADDHPLMLRGMMDFLTSKGYNIIGSAEDGKTAYNLIVKLKPDIALLDIRMPFRTGLEVAEECQKNKLSTKIILITFDKEDNLYDKALEVGVFGYILKDFAVEEIESCITSALNNKPYFSEEIAEYLNHNNRSLKELEVLTKTEKKVVSLISENLNSQQIADQLLISKRTVEKHRSNIVNKLNLEKSTSALSVWAKVNKEHL